MPPKTAQMASNSPHHRLFLKSRESHVRVGSDTFLGDGALILLVSVPRGLREEAEALRSSRGRIGVIARGILRTGIFQLCQYLAQGHDQFVARNMALLELNA